MSKVCKHRAQVEVTVFYHANVTLRTEPNHPPRFLPAESGSLGTYTGTYVEVECCACGMGHHLNITPGLRDREHPQWLGFIEAQPKWTRDAVMAIRRFWPGPFSAGPVHLSDPALHEEL